MWKENNNPVNITFVDKTSDIRNLSENITSDVMLIQGVSQLLKQSDWAQIQDFK